MFDTAFRNLFELSLLVLLDNYVLLALLSALREKGFSKSNSHS